MCAFKQIITNRHYDPYSQKFLSEDPIGFRGKDFNLYRYVGNNPLIYTDPYGLVQWDMVGVGVGQFVGGAAGVVLGVGVGAGLTTAGCPLAGYIVGNAIVAGSGVLIGNGIVNLYTGFSTDPAPVPVQVEQK